MDELRKTILDLRRAMQLREHFDDEIDRWIFSLRSSLESTDGSFGQITSSIFSSYLEIDILVGRQARISANIRNLNPATYQVDPRDLVQKSVQTTNNVIATNLVYPS